VRAAKTVGHAQALAGVNTLTHKLKLAARSHHSETLIGALKKATSLLIKKATHTEVARLAEERPFFAIGQVVDAWQPGLHRVKPLTRAENPVPIRTSPIAGPINAL